MESLDSIDKQIALLKSVTGHNLLRSLRPQKIELPNSAKYALECLTEEIDKFQEVLSNTHEVGMAVVGGPVGLFVHIRRFYSRGNDKLVFEGFDGQGNPTKLIQHLTQLNIILVSVPKLDDKSYRMGFHVNEKV